MSMLEKVKLYSALTGRSHPERLGTDFWKECKQADTYIQLNLRLHEGGSIHLVSMRLEETMPVLWMHLRKALPFMI